MDYSIKFNNEINWDQAKVQSIHNDNHLIFRNQTLKGETEQANNNKELNKLVEYLSDNDQENRFKDSMDKGIASYLQSNIKETNIQSLIENNLSFFEISEDQKVISIRHWSNGKDVQDLLDRLYIDYPYIQEINIERSHICDTKGSPNPIDLSPLQYLKELKTLRLINRASAVSDRDNWQTYLSLPVIPSLECLVVQGAFRYNGPLQNDLPHIIKTFLSKVNANRQIKELDLKDNNHLLKFNFPPIHLGIELNNLQNLKKLDLAHKQNQASSLLYSSDIFSSFSAFSSLQELNLQGYWLEGEQHLQNIFKISSLTTLRLDNIFPPDVFTDWMIKGQPSLPSLSLLQLNNMKLDLLDFHNCAPNLRQLELNHMNFHGDYRTLQGNSKLEVLSISGEQELQAYEVEQLNQIQLPSVKYFHGKNVRHINLAHLFPNVVELNLRESNILSGDVKKLAQLSHLEKLDLSYTSLSGSTLTHLKNLKSLKELNLSGLNLQNGKISHLSSLPLLEKLNLSNSYLSLESFNQLAILSFLKTLDLRNMTNPNITLAHIHQLRQLIPGTEIIN